MLSFKLARSNLRKNFKSFAPFILSCITFFVIMFVATAIMLSPSVAKMPGGPALSLLLTLAFWILAIFSLIVIVYSYRFLQLRRTREFGLYDILGFGKQNVVAVSLWELLLSYLIILVAGTIIGIIFAKFLFLIYVNLIGQSHFDLVIAPLSILIVAFVFIVIFVLLSLISATIIARSSSLNLLKQAEKGEKEPRSNILFAIASIILLGAGYKIALSVENVSQALGQFFVAVLLVIFGTYFFYISFTIWYLKWRKKRKSYYQPRNFITISSMLYRMKANAVGLASITILLSMTVVTLVVTLGLYFGTDRMVRSQFARDAQAVATSSQKSLPELTTELESFANSQGIKLKDMAAIETTQGIYAGQKPSDNETFKVGGEYPTNEKEMVAVTLTTKDSLKSLGVMDLPDLGTKQVALYDFNGNSKAVKNLDWYGQNFEVVDHLSSVGKFPVTATASTDMKNILLVLNSEVELQATLNQYNSAIKSKFTFTPTKNIFFNLSANDQKTLSKAADNSDFKKKFTLSFLSDEMEMQRSVSGGFVFIGFVLGISFILGAALIIYYKQLSEGIQDQRNFKILQEVGLSKTEVAQTIKTQIRTIFFLPIVVTLVHFAFAYNMMSKITGALNVNLTQMIFVTAATIIGLVLVYWIIYKVTSRVYYNLVER